MRDYVVVILLQMRQLPLALGQSDIRPQNREPSFENTHPQSSPFLEDYEIGTEYTRRYHEISSQHSNLAPQLWRNDQISISRERVPVWSWHLNLNKIVLKKRVKS